jgi:large subunit ribosomal protein L28
MAQERSKVAEKRLRQHETRKVWSNVMAQICDICGKGPQFGNNISHAHNVTRRRWNVNLQAVKALVNGSAKRIRVCTSCIKSGKIAKA